jgi:hypothetical protein
MAYTTYNIENAASSYDVDVYCKILKVVKVKTSRWLLCENDGTVVFSARSEGEILTRAGRLEIRRSRGNLNGFRFGSKIDTNVVVAYAGRVWGDMYSLTATRFDGHYWWTQVVDSETGAVSEEVRADYFINYMRIPHNVETELAAELAASQGARFED